MKRILCAIDFSPFARTVLSCAGTLARRLDAELVVFHAVHFPQDGLYHTDAMLDRPTKARKLKKEAVVRIAQLMSATETAWCPEIVEGEPVDRIVEAAGRRKADLVVTASHGLSGVQRLLLGTVVEKLARALTMPLLVLRPAAPGRKTAPDDSWSPEELLVGCHRPSIPDPAVATAAYLARSLPARLTLVHAMAAPLNTEMVEPTEASYARVQQRLILRMDARLKEQLPDNTRAAVRLVPGMAGEALTDMVADRHRALIVVSSRPRSVLGKLFIGSTTEWVLRHAPCPVLVVPWRTPPRLRWPARTEPAATGIVRDARYLEHQPEPGHPDSHLRLETIYRALDQWPHQDRLVRVPPRPATVEELLWVHSKSHVERLGVGAGSLHRMLSADTQASPGSYEASLLAAGGVMAAVEKVVCAELANAFALVRPPGHHAERNRAMGYCLFNNVALGAAFARKALGLERVLIVDWDVHHGNGTQHAFENDPSVLFFSMHQYPHFPGTGHVIETGIGRGEGYTVNVALPRGCGDADYAGLMESLLRPIAEQFAPELILVSAGFDTHRRDPMGGMRMTTDGFAGLTRILMDIARTLCSGRLVLCLEGGYHHGALAESVVAVISQLSGAERDPPLCLPQAALSRKATRVGKRVVSVHERFWKFR